VAKRRFSPFRRRDDESPDTAEESLDDARNGTSRDEGDAAEPEPPTALFDRTADTDEFAALPAERPADARAEDFTVGDAQEPPASGSGLDEDDDDDELRPVTDEWQVDEPEPQPDGSGDERPQSFVPAAKLAETPERPAPPPPSAKPEAFVPADVQAAKPPAPASPDAPAESPEAAAAASPASTDTEERIRVAELAATEAAERRAVEEIIALEGDLERAKREGAAKVDDLEAKLEAAERRAAEAEKRAEAAAEAADSTEDPEGAAAESSGSADEAAAQALSDQARSGAAKWLRAQVRQIERSAAERVTAAAQGGADPEELAAEREKRLASEVERVRK
jgi:hypothetical protein